MLQITDNPITVQYLKLLIAICVVKCRYETRATCYSCLASPDNFIYGRAEAKVLSHVTFMHVLIKLADNCLGQVRGNASEGK